MIQFNLLPDIKLDYIKSKRSKRLVASVAFIAAGASLTVLIILFLAVNVAQKKNLNDLSRDINADISTIQKEPDIDKILTIQNQLNSLTGLHDQKLVASRLFGYLTQITPSKATISNASVDFSGNTMILEGAADSITTINKFSDTLKFATYKTASGKEDKPFKDIVTGLSRSEKAAAYTLHFSFDPVLFNSSEQVTIIVPKIITTRSETEKPSALFQVQPSGGN